ncbi:MAG TPA: hypothetical protein VGO21_01730 [Candidatus Paceibacterota bacterium]|nr:hypothetical protein [Candidatus Paceibacterota bacterium]
MRSSLTEEEFDFVFSKLVSVDGYKKLFRGFKEGNRFEIRRATASIYERTSFYPIMHGVIQQDPDGLLIRAKVSLPKVTVVGIAFMYIFMIFWFTGHFHTNGFNSKTLNDLSEFIAIFFSFQLAFFLVFYFEYKKMIKYIVELFEAEMIF